MDKDWKYLCWADAGAKIFSTCSKAKFFAIILDRRGHVVATGYNGAPPGFVHCEDGGCPRSVLDVCGGSYGDCIAVHAEANAILRASRDDMECGTLYVGGLPCWDCSKLILGTGLCRVVYCDDGRVPVDAAKIMDLFALSDVQLVCIDEIEGV